jgi:F-type H+-transporting ATPase subunit gamma
LTGFSEQPTYEDARRIAAAVRDPFLEGRIDMVQVIYTRFITVGSQEVVVRPLMPLEREIVRDEDERAHESEGPRAAYEFEPGPGEILERLLPRYVEARIFAALLNAAASEQAARQRAMKAASENADELTVSLTRVMNRARQDAITTEITEIVGGAEALRHAGQAGAEEPFGEDLRVRVGAE